MGDDGDSLVPGLLPVIMVTSRSGRRERVAALK